MYSQSNRTQWSAKVQTTHLWQTDLDYPLSTMFYSTLASFATSALDKVWYALYGHTDFWERKKCSIDSLPLEVLEEIVEFLHDDKPALLACSQVSRRLLAVSSYRHSSVRVDWKKPSYHERFLPCPPSPRTFEDFIGLISTSESVRTSIRHLDLHPVKDFSWAEVNTNLLISILSRLPSLRHLTIQFVSLSPVNESSLETFFQKSPPTASLDILDFPIISFPNFATAFAILSPFRYIKTIKVKEITYEAPKDCETCNTPDLNIPHASHADQVISSRFAAPLRNDHLEISVCDTDTSTIFIRSLQHLFSYPESQPPSSMDVYSSHVLTPGIELDEIAAFLESDSTRHLHDFSIDLRTCSDSNKSEWDLLGLSSLTRISNLNLRIYAYGYRGHMDPVDWNVLIQTLNHASKTLSSLKTMTISIKYFPWNDMCCNRMLNEIDFVSFEHALEHFPLNVTLVLAIDEPTQVERLKRFFRSRRDLSLCASERLRLDTFSYVVRY
ncbi:hypothetical protein C8Q75DRAFT_745873 [Abortiporus biennis]|nr:hypothetical protein C8Q75DRAFT_745873 [Abortiporus biennis]